MRTYLPFLLLIMVGCYLPVNAQFSNNRANIEREYTELNSLLDKLEQEAANSPFDVRRVAFFKLDYEQSRFTKQGIRYIKNEIERVLNESTPISMVNVREFDEPDPLQIIGSDSSLTIMNTNGWSTEQGGRDRLSNIVQKYALDGILEGSIQYRDGPGYILSLRLVRGDSRAVAWNISVMSNDMEQEEEMPESKTILISAGGGLLPYSGYVANGQIPSTDPVVIDYSANLTLRQSINSKNSGYLGVSLGYHQYRSAGLDENQNIEPFSLTSFRAGVLYFLSVAEKSEIPNDYWIEIYLGPDILIVSENDNLFRINQGINFNLARNLGLSLDLQYLLSSEPSLEDANSNTTVDFKSIGYALRFLVRF